MTSEGRAPRSLLERAAALTHRLPQGEWTEDARQAALLEALEAEVAGIDPASPAFKKRVAAALKARLPGPASAPASLDAPRRSGEGLRLVELLDSGVPSPEELLVAAQDAGRQDAPKELLHNGLARLSIRDRLLVRASFAQRPDLVEVMRCVFGVAPSKLPELRASALRALRIAIDRLRGVLPEARGKRGPFRDLVGVRFGHLVVVDLVGRMPQRWRCRCDCGETVRATKYALMREGKITCNAKACPYRARLHAAVRGYKDLCGKRFGALQVLEVAGRDHCSRLLYACQCDCGRPAKVVRGTHLRSGAVRSCGCGADRFALYAFKGRKATLRSIALAEGVSPARVRALCAAGVSIEAAVVQVKAAPRPAPLPPMTLDGTAIGLNELARRSRASVVSIKKGLAAGLTPEQLRDGIRVPQPPKPFKDLTGRRFDRLVAMERAGSRKGGVLWRCRCDCGGEKITLAASLLGGHTRSCGCLNRELIVAVRRDFRDPWVGAKQAAKAAKRVAVATERERHAKKAADRRKARDRRRALLVIAAALRLTYRAIRARELRGMSFEQACTTPPHRGVRHEDRDLRGRRFGRLLVKQESEQFNRARTWLCWCDCGGRRRCRTTELITRRVTSCGVACPLPKIRDHGATESSNARGAGDSAK